MLIETPAQTYVTRESSKSIGSNDKNEKAYEIREQRAKRQTIQSKMKKTKHM